jgi:hypothetical protein
MSKSFEALARGYVLFDVNGKRFWSYNSARMHRVFLTDVADLPDVIFTGLHVFKGWQCFYRRISQPFIYHLEDAED